MATHSSILAWRISWTEEPGELVHGVADEEGNGNPLQYSCLQNFMDRGAWWVSPWGCRIGHNWAINTHTHTHTHTSLKRKVPNLRCLGKCRCTSWVRGEHQVSEHDSQKQRGWEETVLGVHMFSVWHQLASFLFPPRNPHQERDHSAAGQSIACALSVHRPLVISLHNEA